MTTRLQGLGDEAFREKYLDYDELTAQVHAWKEAYPDLVRLRSIGKSGEGRELWLLEIGAALAEPRPAVWIDGNMHASELCGSSAALVIASDALAVHRGEDRGLPKTVVEKIKGIHFYILPRFSPDGAEAILKSGRYVRSSPV